jgi:hypothetical protein
MRDTHPARVNEVRVVVHAIHFCLAAFYVLSAR